MNRVETMRALLIPTVLALVVSACSSTRAPAGSGDSRTIYPVDLPPGFGEADWMVTGPPSSPYFGDSLAEAGDTNGDGYRDTFQGVRPGTPVCFDIIVKQNDTVPPTAMPQMFRANLQVLGDGFTPLDTRDIFFLVPPLIQVSGGG